MFPELLDEETGHFGAEPLARLERAGRLRRHHRHDGTKLAALAAHVSQGTGEAEPWVRKRAEELAAQSELGCTYAEGFKALRFVDDEEREPAP
jgi:hypothetical protein